MTARSGAAAEFEVVVVGAGLAGVVTADALAKRGVSVALVDPRETAAACFKAEKIEADQADLLRKLGLLGTLRPMAGVIEEVVDARAGRRIQTIRLEQYGVHYHEMVNAFRAHLPATVHWEKAKVATLSLSADRQTVGLGNGKELRARLVVLSTGTNGDLHGSLGIARTWVSRDHSFAFGFDVEPTTGATFPWNSVSYYPVGTDTRLAYVTFFPIGKTTRCNLFSYHVAKDPFVRAFMTSPKDELLRLLPGLTRVTGDFRVVSKVQGNAVELYTVDGRTDGRGERSFLRDGLVLVGDAFQSVCPTTGSGVSKVLTDADVLANDCVPVWLRSEGMAKEKLEGFYAHPRKVRTDADSLHRALYRRRLSLDTSIRWRVHREKSYLAMRLEGIVGALRGAG
ncbi:MAG: NAD(P)/FAD-dependent oxidoreductase [Polyangiaceae bacterium]